MKKSHLSVLFFLISLFGYSQNKQTEAILKEGKLLYRLEKGSWYGTDDFLLRWADKRDSIGGYLSYIGEDQLVNTVFFSRYDPNHILARYKFDSIPKEQPVRIDTLNQKATPTEADLITIRQDALERVYDNKDGFFEFYQNTSLNFIPVIDNDEKKVLVLTAPKIDGVLILGADFKLSYDKMNRFKKKEKIHNSIVQFPFKAENQEQPIEQTIHSHVRSDYINSTDICTLLLYKDYLSWSKHIVVSPKFISIFDIEKEELFFMTREAWEKISGRQDE